MVALYYLLARDEERRMLGQFGETYHQYMARTVMFLPKPVEAAFLNSALPRNSFLRTALVLLLLTIAIISGAFALGPTP